MKKNLIIIGILIVSINSYSQQFIKKSINAFDTTTIAAFGMSAIDYDTDGLLDVYSVSLIGKDQLFHNEGNGNFKAITLEQGGIDGVSTDYQIISPYSSDLFFDVRLRRY